MRKNIRRRRLAGAAAILALSIAGCGEGGAGAPVEDASGVAEHRLVRVPQDAATINDAVALVASGGMVLIEPGTYSEEVAIDKPDVTVRGTDRNSVVIDGGGVRPFGVFVSADGVRIENLTVHSALFYGVLVTGMHDENGPLAHGGPGYVELDPAAFPPVERFSIDHVTAHNNGLYGIYAFNSRHGSITNSYASGSADSGFYVGQCEKCDILVASNVAERNAVGFENANASDSLMIAGNRFSGNRIGMILTSDYQEAFTPQRDNLVVGNLVSDNANADSPAHALGGFGIGVGIAGGQGNHLAANRIDGNPVAGVTLSNAEDIPALKNEFVHNTLKRNGLDVVDTSADRAPASGNCFDDNTATTSAPPSLLTTTCPASGTSADAAATRELPAVTVPDGMSFLKVPAPPDQPSMAEVEVVPDPLPDTTQIPPASEFPLPDATLLAEWAATA